VLVRENVNQWMMRYFKTDQSQFEFLPTVQPVCDADYEWPLPVIDPPIITQSLAEGTNVITIAAADFEFHHRLHAISVSLTASLAVHIYLQKGSGMSAFLYLYNGPAATLHIFQPLSIYVPPDWNVKVAILGAAGTEAVDVCFLVEKRKRFAPI